MSVQIIAARIRFGIMFAVTGVMVYALVVSASHIVHVAQTIGVPGWQAQTAWILVDLPALIGKLLQVKLPRHGYVFTTSTRRTGIKLTIFSGSLSLACNVASGLINGSWGAAGWGAFVVTMFLVLETVATRIKATSGSSRTKSTDTDQDNSTTVAPATVKAANRAGRKCVTGCTCGRHARTSVTVAP
jgi:hypothetical protein